VILAEQNLTNASFFGATLTSANFRQANLTNTDFPIATLTGANLSAADARGAEDLDPTGAIVSNLIQSNGHINALDLSAGQVLVVRDYDGNPNSG
jgi:uncharacterized protein YjbI with pentapeptide repeats